VDPRCGRQVRGRGQRRRAYQVSPEPTPLTRREIRFGKTCKTEQAAQIEPGKLLAMARPGGGPTEALRRPVSEVDRRAADYGWMQPGDSGRVPE
jgi:hypothetical protein